MKRLLGLPLRAGNATVTEISGVPAYNPDMDAAHFVVRKANVSAVLECRNKGYSCAATHQALWQECAEKYADMLGSELEAIRQYREFLDDWEASVKDTFQ